MIVIVRRLLVALMLVAGAVAPASVSAQGSNAATDRGVYVNPQQTPTNDEQELLRVLGDGRMPDHRIDGWTYYANQELRHLVQPEGRTWRDFRASTSRWFHAVLLALAVAAVALLFFVRGAQTYERDPQGRRILRFRAVDRFVHWLTAVSFVTLALSGLNIVFGRIVIERWLGDHAFNILTQYGLIVHNTVGFAFLIGVAAMTLMWMQDNFFHRVDLVWLKRGGGLLTGEHVPAEKFNAGQKGIYWIALLAGLAMGTSGILLLLPIAILGVNGMQLVHAAHTIVAALFIAVIIGHIYLGTVGVSGSFDAMAKGTVDLEWAKTHHPLWVERDRAAGGGPAGGNPPVPASPEKR
jgi:formate dehydrogenase subunit gamma